MEVEKSEKEVRTHLSPAEYWEWRTTIMELQLARKDAEKTTLELKLLQKETEMLAVRQHLFQCTRMDAARKAVEAAQVEYERFKGVLEKSLGQSLNKKVIDDITFEVRELPDENNKPPAN